MLEFIIPAASFQTLKALPPSSLIKLTSLGAATFDIKFK